MKKPTMIAWIFMVFVLVESQFMISSSAVESVTVPLNTPKQVAQQADTYTYYQTSIPNPNSTQIFLITVSADIKIWIGIFISTSNSPNFSNDSWPNRTSYTQQCFYSSIDTCALRLPNVEQLPNGQKILKVYFTVFVSDDCMYSLVVEVQHVYPIRVNRKYGVSLNNAESSMVELSGSNFITSQGRKIQQIIITCFYTSYRYIGHFQLLAAQGVFPNPSQHSGIVSKSLNMFTQILQLNPLPNENSSYYILIQGENSTKLNFSVQGIEQLQNPQLIVNETLAYLSKNPINYTYNNIFIPSSDNSSLSPLHIKLFAYRGYGQFIVDYCNGMYNSTFQNAGGEGGSITITPQMRHECYVQVSSVGGLLSENLVVGVSDVFYQFGYGIGLFQDSFDDFLSPSQKQIGSLSGINDSAVYNVELFNFDINFTLTIQIVIGAINVRIQQCPQNQTPCLLINETTLIEPTKVIQRINFTCPGRMNCQVVVSQYQSANYSKYSLLNEHANKDSYQLMISKPVTDIVFMNEYKFYFINVTELRLNSMTKFTNSTIINIRKTQINGDSIMLTSTIEKHPTFSDIFSGSTDVKYHWEGTATYTANQTYPNYIYIGVKGDSESIFHIQFVLNISANIPSAYLDMVEQGQNDYTLTSATPYILLKYVSHIIPYTITFSPSPSCIKFGNRLPFSNNCTSASIMPNVFRDSVLYFNISQSLVGEDAIFKFSSYVNSGSYLLTQDKPILISCERNCYQLIVVVINTASANIIHNGQGNIKIISGKGQDRQVSNTAITLNCSLSQCSYTFNASMKYGGNMQVSFEANKASEIEWRTKPMALPTEGVFKYFYMMIPKYSDFSSLLFYAQAADLSIYYNIFSMNSSYTNTMKYTYPNPKQYMQVSYGDPLQQIHVVDIDKQTIKSLQCLQVNVICIATFAVTLNVSVQYSLQYIKNGLGYYSSNTYQYDISPEWPILSLKQQYSISYFSHEIDFIKQVTSFRYRIYIQPISNCRPQIQTQSTYYLKNYYTDVMLSFLMPGQTRINYRVVSNQICLFHTGLSTSPFQLLFPNVMYMLQMGDFDNVTFTYQHRYYMKVSFFVKVSSNVSAIIVKKLTYSNNTLHDSQIILPSIEKGYNDGYVLNSSTLSIGQAQPGQYLILLKFGFTSQSRPKQLTVMIQQQNRVITLLHNQQHVYIFNPSSNSLSAQTSRFVNYQYHSTSGFYIFIAVNRLSVRLIVRDGDSWGPSSELANVIISNMSQPWILINPNNITNSTVQKLINYDIQCQFLGDPQTGLTSTLKLHIQQQGTQGLTLVYPGISIYDAFVHETAMNCYRYVTPMILGEKTMTIDLHFLTNDNELPMNTTVNDLVIGIASIMGSTTKLAIKASQITPITYRMVMDFHSISTYKICYVLKSIKMVGIEYSIVVNVPSMPMIYPRAYSNQSDIYESSYSVFEYINHYYDIIRPDIIHSQPIVMTVINCIGTSTILAALSYSDMQTGKITEVSAQWSDNRISAALVDVPHGYYYFAVKPKFNKVSIQKFRTTVLQAGMVKGKPCILQSLYYINWNIKYKYTQVTIEEKRYLNIQIPTILKSASAGSSFNPDKIVYSLYLINLGVDKKQYKYTIDSYIRCPLLMDEEYHDDKIGFKPIQTVTEMYPYHSTSEPKSTVSFNVEIEDFKPMSNISIKGEVYVNTQNGNTNIFQFFYELGEIQISENETPTPVWKPLKWIIALLILFICLGSAIITFKLYIRRKNRTVSFEVTDHPMGRQMQSRPQSNKSNAPSHRKPLNQSAGYGQFVDQT